MTEDFDPEKAMQALRSVGATVEEFADALAEYQNKLFGLEQ